MLRLFRLLCLATLFGVASSSLAAGSGKGPITIGVNNWAENIAVANMWQILLTERGYEVSLFSADKAPIWIGVAKGDIQLTLEGWLPATDKAYYDRFEASLDKIGPWFENAWLGLVVPDYVEDVSSIDQLNAHKAEFDGTLYGIDPGSSLMALTRAAVKAYALDFNVIESSEAGMLISLERAYKARKPILVTLWNPHWVWAKYKLKYLKDPKGVYGKPDAIYVIAHKGFAHQYPEVAGWLAKWRMDDDSLGSLMSEIRDQGESDPQKGAKAWIEGHHDLVDPWFK